MKGFFGGPGGPLLIVVGLALAGVLVFSSFLGNRGWGYPGYGGFFAPPIGLFGLWGASSIYGGYYGSRYGGFGRQNAYHNFERSEYSGRHSRSGVQRSSSPSLRQGSLGKRGGFGAGK